MVDVAGALLGIAFVVVLALLLLFTVGGTIIGFIAPPPAIERFVPRAELTSSITRDLSPDVLADAVGRIPGMTVVDRSGSMILISVKPGIRSVQRGSGSWVRIVPGDSQLEFQIRAKSFVNMTIYSNAIHEAEREIRQALTESGAIRFDVYENVAVPTTHAIDPRHGSGSGTIGSTTEPPPRADPGAPGATGTDTGSSGMWWEN